MRELTIEDARWAVLGGGVFACGGGGWQDHGELMGQLATTLNRPVLAGVDELPEDSWVATVTAIGAPAAPDCGNSSSCSLTPSPPSSPGRTATPPLSTAGSSRRHLG